MRYYYVDEAVETPHENLVQGELITEREAMKDKRRDSIHANCRLVIWPAQHTHFVGGIRFPTKESCICLRPNGDPYGSGYEGTETQFPSDNIGIYRGDIGCQTLDWWRIYAKKHNLYLQMD